MSTSTEATTDSAIPAFLSDGELRRRASDLAELLDIRERMHASRHAKPADIEQADTAVLDAERVVVDSIARRDQHRQTRADGRARR